MTEPCEFVAGLCIHCGDATQGACEGWNAPEDAIKVLRTRVAELEAAAKLALDALVATTPVPREYDEAYYRREWPKEFAALDALRKAGIK